MENRVHLDAVNLRLIIAILDAVCVALTPEQREAVSQRLKQLADATNDAAKDVTEQSATAILFALSQIAAGTATEALPAVLALFQAFGSAPKSPPSKRPDA